MRPNADDVRLARWWVAALLRTGAAVLIVIALTSAACRWPDYRHASLMADSGFAPRVSLRGTFLAEFTMLATALALFFLAQWGTRLLVRPPESHLCPTCGYDTSGVPSGKCPECGKA